MVTVNDAAGNKTFHPMKGVKTTQFLIDIINRGTGKLHWRGDKTDFHDFAGAFHDLQGLSDAPLDAVGMQEFSDFLNATWYVPNPYRTYPAGVARGRHGGTHEPRAGCASPAPRSRPYPQRA
jgi:hypothetical protein